MSNVAGALSAPAGTASGPADRSWAWPGTAPPTGWRRLDSILLAAVSAVAAGLRFFRLSYPHHYVFDETYYARDACLYLGRSMAFCKAPQATEFTTVHPPLGKWLIALGEWVWGYNSFGWRVSSALAGTALVVVVFLLARRLFGRGVAALAGLLAATDLVLITQSRVGMLDMFLALFVALGFLFAAYEHDRLSRLGAGLGSGGRLSRPGGWLVRMGGRLRSMGWRLAMGVAFGAAIAVKWSGAFALLGAGLLLASWTLRRPGSGPDGALFPARRWRDLLLSAGAVGAPVVIVYLASYAAWFTDHRYSLSAFIHRQRAMYTFQNSVRSANPFHTRAWTWPFQIHPVAYWHVAGHQLAHQVVLRPNALIWWGALPAGAWLGVRAIRAGRDGERLVMAAWLAQYLPWLVVARPLFFYYMTPVAPFMDVALAAGLVALAGRSPFARRLVVAYLAGALALSAYLYPGVGGALHPHL